MDDPDKIARLVRAAHAVNREAAKVAAWVTEQTSIPRLVRNGDAPTWPAYETAQRELSLAASALGMGDPVA